MKKDPRYLALCFSLMITLVACSQTAKSSNYADVKKAFEGRFPGKPIQMVSATPVKGIYEVIVDNKQVVYTNSDASYLFIGDLIDVLKKESLTEKRMAGLQKVDFKSLPFEYALKDVRNKGERKLVVFSDPDCRFCEKLEREGLRHLDNITIYTFLYPLSQLHPDAMRKSKQIWCSQNKVADWSGFMRNGKPLTGPDNCNTPLEKIKQLGEQLGITGAPALIFPSGKIVAGAIGSKAIEQLLNE